MRGILFDFEVDEAMGKTHVRGWSVINNLFFNKNRKIRDNSKTFSIM